jgi:peptidoglycan hydrolase-like protein with peptidoglycan-binding domain
MQTLKKGSTGPEVGLLRRLLNRRLVPSPALPEANVFGARYNGAMPRIDFGTQMDAAVKVFQRSKRLKDDGIVGPLTWRALGLTLDINRPVSPSSQPTGNTCYAAAATMVLGPTGAKSFAPGPTPPGVAADDHWATSFSRQFSWPLEFGMSPMPNALVRFLHAGPFWFAGNLPFPTGPSYHAVVVGSIWGDGDPDRTMLLIYDPWPVNAGEVYGIILGDYVRSFPTAFRYIIHQ